MQEYQEILQYLFNLQLSGIKLGLGNISALLKQLGNPQKKWPAVHIAGTNGKGSTAAFIYGILRKTGLRVGLYTSPHLVDFSERIRVNDEAISWDEIIGYIRSMKKHVDKNQNTFFEATSALAFQYFADRQVDVAVVETGLGGRLDATNLVEPLVTVITSIGYDHQQFLGNDLRQIAREKAGIIKGGIDCITNNTDPVVLEELQTVCQSKGSLLYRLDPENNIEILKMDLHGSQFNGIFPEKTFHNLEITLAGYHQIINAGLATLSMLKIKTIPIKEIEIRNGLKEARWPARLQMISERPLVLLDVAHNVDGFEKVFNTIRSNLRSRRILVIAGLAKDKDYEKIARVLSENVSTVGIIRNFSDRGMPAEKLKIALQDNNLTADVFEFVDQAYSHFLKSSGEDDVILIIGSHYLAGEFLKKYKNIDFK
jgi:dihydrofolate synthase/folylpolyglutamate synthase